MVTLFSSVGNIKPTNRVFGLGTFPTSKDNTKPPARPYTDDDYRWYLENVADWSHADTEPLTPPVDALGILSRVSIGKPVSMSELNAMREDFGYDPFDAACCCEAFDTPGECGCGTRLYQVGLKRYEAEARERLQDVDRWADQGEPENDEAEMWGGYPT